MLAGDYMLGVTEGQLGSQDGVLGSPAYASPVHAEFSSACRGIADLCQLGAVTDS